MNATTTSSSRNGRNGGWTLFLVIFLTIFITTRFLPTEQPTRAINYRRVPPTRFTQVDEFNDEDADVLVQRDLSLTADSTDTAGSADIYVPSFDNVLPNPYLTDDANLTEYRNSIMTFVHNPKSGGTTLKICMKRLANGISPLLLTSFNRAEVETDFMNGVLKPEDHDMFVGGTSFGVCESFSSRRCSYFTIVREPYDRMVSHYFFCKSGGQTSLPCVNKTLEEYAIDANSILFNQIALKVSCRCDGGNCGDQDKHPWNCQMDHSYSQMYQTRKEVLTEIMDKVEREFAVIGLTEEYDTTLRILQHTFGLPFYDECRQLRQNSGTYLTTDKTKKDRRKEIARKTLLKSERVRAVLRPDVILYNRMKEIFNKEKEKLFSI